jgi:hypothetical protein
LYSSSGIIRMMKSRMMNGEKRNVCRTLVGKPEGKRPLGRSRCRLVGNITMDPREIGWTDLAQDRDQWWALVNTVMNLLVSYIAGKFLSMYTTGGLSKRAQLHELS